MLTRYNWLHFNLVSKFPGSQSCRVSVGHTRTSQIHKGNTGNSKYTPPLLLCQTPQDTPQGPSHDRCEPSLINGGTSIDWGCSGAFHRCLIGWRCEEFGTRVDSLSCLFCSFGFWAVFMVWRVVLCCWGATAIMECNCHEGMYSVCRTQDFSSEHWFVTRWSILFPSPVSNVVVYPCIYTDIKRTYTKCAMLWIVLNYLRLKCHQLRAERQAPARPLSELNNVTHSGSKQHNR